MVYCSYLGRLGSAIFDDSLLAAEQDGRERRDRGEEVGLVA